MPMEEWRDIQGYEGLYQVSNKGNVYSVRKNANLCPKIGKNGYASVTLIKDGKHWYPLVHRLVAKAFVPNPENKPQVDHINGNRLDNRAENFRWCTQKENLNFEIARKRQSECKKGEKNPMYQKRPWNYGIPQTEEQKKRNSEIHKGLIYPSKRKPLVQIGEDGTIKEWETTYEAEIEGYSQGHISQACRGVYNTLGNHRYKKCLWYFKEDYEKMLEEQLSL